jgi:hypothetical protein
MVMDIPAAMLWGGPLPLACRGAIASQAVRHAHIDQLRARSDAHTSCLSLDNDAAWVEVSVRFAQCVKELQRLQHIIDKAESHVRTLSSAHKVRNVSVPGKLSHREWHAILIDASLNTSDDVRMSNRDQLLYVGFEMTWA